MKNSSKVDARPAFQWYPDDWLSEAGLRACDLGARGLWIDLLCFMFGMHERGKLKVNNRAFSQAELSRLVGRPEAEVQAHLKQLVDFGVLSKDDDGTIYSRRMVRDESKRQAKIKAGRKGGLSKRQAKGGSPSPSPSPSPSSNNKIPPYNEFFSAWNLMAKETGVRSMRSPMRDTAKKALAARWKDKKWRTEWAEAITKIKDSQFLLGESGWKATPDWFLRPDNVFKIMEGSYSGGKSEPSPAPTYQGRTYR